MTSVKHSVAHRPKIGECVKNTTNDRQEPRIFGPPDESVSVRTEGTTEQICADRNVAEKWINGHYAMR